ncbi:MAG: 50S ribosomal protein L5, partial [Candidatus Eremiobacteraeota bacterium]|nr:50S ribosomal protein L5 [Candidatus Eremiobacteraeota bacterium]
MASRLRERYEADVRKQLQDRFGYKNGMQVPKLEKVVVNMSVGDAIQNAKALDAAIADLQTITGQKPVQTIATKSIA